MHSTSSLEIIPQVAVYESSFEQRDSEKCVPSAEKWKRHLGA